MNDRSTSEWDYYAETYTAGENEAWERLPEVYAQQKAVVVNWPLLWVRIAASYRWILYGYFISLLAAGLAFETPWTIWQP